MNIESIVAEADGQHLFVNDSYWQTSQASKSSKNKKTKTHFKMIDRGKHS